MADGALDQSVRRADPDRWLASRFVADPARREDLIALYAFDAELDRARRLTSTPLMAQIRLTWWSEALDEIAAGSTPRSHPVVLALAAAIGRRDLPLGPLLAMVDARIEASDAGAFDLQTAADWAERTGGSAAEIGVRILDGAASPETARPAGRLIALAGLMRAGLLARETARPLLSGRLRDADRAARGLSAAAFPAIAPATLIRSDLAGRTPSELGRRLRLLWAVARGRL